MELNLKLNDKYEILTPNGFKNFIGVRNLQKDRHFIIKLNNGTTIKCSDNHPFWSDNDEISSADLFVGVKLDSSDDDNVVVESIEIVESKMELYDVVEVDGGNIFNVDGIISHNCSFITSGKSVVPGPIIQWYLENLKKEPIAKEGIDGNYWKWKYPEQDKTYVVSADVARGDGKDYSAFHIIDIDNLEQVAEYQGKLDTKLFGDLLVNAATEYNDALLIIENANIGWGSIQQVVDRDYKNLFYATSDMKYVDTKSQMTNKYYRDDRKMVAGFTTTSKTRPLIVEKLVEYFRDKTAIVYSNRLINELFSFVYGPSLAQADYGANDDLVMSFAIALWVRDTAIRLRTEGVLAQKNLMKQMIDYQPMYKENEIENESWEMDDGHGNRVNLDSWLLG